MVNDDVTALVGKLRNNKTLQEALGGSGPAYKSAEAANRAPVYRFTDEEMTRIRNNDRVDELLLAPPTSLAGDNELVFEFKSSDGITRTAIGYIREYNST